MSNKSSKALAIDLASGTVGGVAQLIIGHPFDTVKVRLQQGSSSLSPVAVTRHILATQGPLGLYKGFGPPLVTIAAFNALLFSTTGYLNRLIWQYKNPDNDGQLSPLQHAFTGALAGVPVSLLATPTELLKCRLQAQGGMRPPPGYRITLQEAQNGARILYSGPLNALRLILKLEGGVHALFRGLAPTLAREIPGNAAYFGVYSLLKMQLAKMQGLESTTQLKTGSLMIAGGLAGAAFWIPTLPADTVKTRIQLDSPFNPQYRKGMVDCARQIVKAGGVQGLFAGWAPCLLRSIPANSALFLAYEATLSTLTRL